MKTSLSHWLKGIPPRATPLMLTCLFHDDLEAFGLKGFEGPSEIRVAGIPGEKDFPENIGDDIFYRAIGDFPASGKVMNDAGLPFPGVNVVEKGTTKGTATDASGKHTLVIRYRDLAGSGGDRIWSEEAKPDATCSTFSADRLERPVTDVASNHIGPSRSF